MTSVHYINHIFSLTFCGKCQTPEGRPLIENIPFKLAESSLQFLLSDAFPAPDRLAPGRLVVKFTISFEGFHFSFLSEKE